MLGLSGSFGFSSIVIPGAGEPNIDTFVANPYENKKQRQEAEVHSLLEKVKNSIFVIIVQIPADMITMDPDFVGKVNANPVENLKKVQKVELEANSKGKEIE